MGRRSIHTQDELRHLILGSARQIIERDGLIGFSAREIARAVGYSAGTIYNIFDSLDELLLLIQADLLSEVVANISSVTPSSDPRDYVDRLADAYVDFAVEHARLWNLFVAHQLSSQAKVPPQVQEHLNSIATIVGKGIQPLMPAASPAEVAQSAQALWAGVHGITAVAVTEKGANINVKSAKKFVRLLTSTFTRGLSSPA
jgi:AcrR family transcriptional regulator